MHYVLPGLQLRKSKASQSVWVSQSGSTKTKYAVCCATVLSTLPYGAESWTVYMAQAPSLNAYMMRHLREILGVKWWHFIPNQDILMKTNMDRCTKYRYLSIAASEGPVISPGSTTLSCRSKFFIPSSTKSIKLMADQNSISKIPSKETGHGKGSYKGAGVKKLTTDHSGES